MYSRSTIVLHTTVSILYYVVFLYTVLQYASTVYNAVLAEELSAHSTFRDSGFLWSVQPGVEIGVCRHLVYTYAPGQ